MILILPPRFIFTSTVLQYRTDEHNCINRKTKKLYHNRINLNKNLYLVNQKESEDLKKVLIIIKTYLVKNTYFMQNGDNFKKFKYWESNIVIKAYIN